MGDIYSRIIKSRYRKSLKEENDCAIVASAIVCRVSYQKAHGWFEVVGRGARSPVHTPMILKVIKSRGYSVTSVKSLRQPSGHRYTPKTIGNRLAKGYHLCTVHGHIFAAVNGEVEDWTKERKHRILEAFKVTRPAEVTV